MNIFLGNFLEILFELPNQSSIIVDIQQDWGHSSAGRALRWQRQRFNFKLKNNNIFNVFLNVDLSYSGIICRNSRIILGNKILQIENLIGNFIASGKVELDPSSISKALTVIKLGISEFKNTELN